MAKETQRILLTFIFIFSACTFGLFVLSTIGARWFSCTSKATKNNKFDLIFTLWQYCEYKHGEYVCHNIDDSTKFNDVFFDFKVLRLMLIACDVFSGLLMVTSVSFCFLQEKKFCRRLVIFQCVTAILTVVVGLSSLVYGAARAQDMVGLETRFAYGWSCVMGWIATIIAFLNAIMALVLGCVYLDTLHERMLAVREELDLDNISIRSETLRRINELDDSIINPDEENTAWATTTLPMVTADNEQNVPTGLTSNCEENIEIPVIYKVDETETINKVNATINDDCIEQNTDHGCGKENVKDTIECVEPYDENNFEQTVADIVAGSDVERDENVLSSESP